MLQITTETGNAAKTTITKVQYVTKVVTVVNAVSVNSDFMAVVMPSGKRC